MPKMKIAFSCIAALLLVTELSLGQPKVFLPEGKYLEFGDVLSLTPKKRPMIIKNSGDDTLIISNVGASCGCTALLLSESRIPPSDSASLMITLNSDRLSGKVEKLISFNTNDINESLVEVKFSANVINLLEIDPKYIFLKTTVGTPAEQEIQISNLSDKTIRLLEATSSVPELSIKLSDKKIPPHADVSISMKFTPESPGAKTGDITIKTDHPLLPLFNIRFHSWTK